MANVDHQIKTYFIRQQINNLGFEHLSSGLFKAVIEIITGVLQINTVFHFINKAVEVN